MLKRNNTDSVRVTDITYCPHSDVKNIYLDKSEYNRPNQSYHKQNRFFYSMTPVGHRFLENIDSHDPQYDVIARLAKEFSKVLEYNCRVGFDLRLQAFWRFNSPLSTVSSLRDCSFGAVFNEVWYTLFTKPCPNPEIMIKATCNILMVVKNWDTVDTDIRQQAIALVDSFVKQGLNPQLNFDPVFSNMHEVIFALIVSSVSEICEGFAHTVVCLSQHPLPQPKNIDEYTMATYEALRMYPLFTVSTRPSLHGNMFHQINYVNYHRRKDLYGDDAGQFNWQRWRKKSLIGKSFLFGIGNNRSCPGRNSAIKMIPIMARVWLENYSTMCLSKHTRMLPYGGLAMVAPVQQSKIPWRSWQHLAVTIYVYAVFFLGKKWWVKYRNQIASRTLAEADAYYDSIRAVNKLDVQTERLATAASASVLNANITMKNNYGH